MRATLTPVYMNEKVYEDLLGVLRQTYPNVCVLYIDRVSNEKLETAFETRRKIFGEFSNERRLFHGTNPSALVSILNDGYDSNFSTRAAYGKGTYFCSTASYSKEYSTIVESGESYLIVNRVLLGRNTTSNNLKYSGDSGGDGKSIFVTKHNDAALPEYVICFHKNASI